jgi:capsular polysaccharide export protein
MNFVYFGAGYDHYYSNAGNTVIATVSVENLTRYRGVQRLPSHARREQFEAWLARCEDKASIIQRAREIINLNRVQNSALSEEANAVRQRVVDARAAGRPVICLFGRILYDIAMPMEGGPAHKDMQDWLNHSIECLSRSDALVLVKPHPNEINKTYAQAAEYFTDLITVPCSDNVILLQHRWFNIRDLVPLLDLGVLWSGSTALELTASGVPVIVCSTWGAKDYPVEFPVPRDRVDYARMLAQPRAFGVDAALQERCALLIHYLSTSEIMTPFPYARMPVRHRDRGPKEWDMPAIERFLAEGDSNIDYITSKCL